MAQRQSACDYLGGKMSYDVTAKDEQGNTVVFPEPHYIKGGTYQLGGSLDAWLNITYNYNFLINKVLPEGMDGLHGKAVVDTIKSLQSAADMLAFDFDHYYWKATEGNVKAALLGLVQIGLKAIEIEPKCTWEVC